MERANPVSFASQERERCGSTLSFGPERKDCQMSRKVGGDRVRIDCFFAGPGARAGQCYHLLELAQCWSRGTTKSSESRQALTEMAATEELAARIVGYQMVTS